MVDIQYLLEDLQSDNPIDRYDECKELSDSQSIPDEAITALREATQDPQLFVAQAAQRALDLHSSESESNPIDAIATEEILSQENDIAQTYKSIHLGYLTSVELEIAWLLALPELSITKAVLFFF